MNSKTTLTITLTRKEAEGLRDLANSEANYMAYDEMSLVGGGVMKLDKEEKEMLKYGNQALDKIEAALRCEPASAN